MRRIGFTGTRNQLTFEQATALRFWLESRVGEFHHGDCIGADEAAHDIVHSLRGWRIVVHPGLGPRELQARVTGWNLLCPAKPNLERNSDIVNETDELLATPTGPETVRSGTWSTIRKARRAGKPLTIIWPDGAIEMEHRPTVLAAKPTTAAPATDTQNQSLSNLEGNAT